MDYSFIEQVLETAKTSPQFSEILDRHLRATCFTEYHRVVETQPVMEALSLAKLTSNSAELISAVEEFLANGGVLGATCSELQQRIYVRGVFNALRYGKYTLDALSQVFPAQMYLFRVNDPIKFHELENARKFIFETVKIDAFKQALQSAQGYDVVTEISSLAPYNAVGEFLEIPASKEAFREAMLARRHWVYSKFSVTPNGDTWMVFFA